MTRYFLFTFFLFITFKSIGADSTGIISGNVYDNLTREPLSGATVVYGLKSGTSTDKNGYFIFRSNPGNIQVSFQYIGYKSFTKTVNLNINDSLVLDIGLDRLVMEIDQLVISAGKLEQKISELTVSVSILKPEMLTENHITDARELINKSSGIEVIDGQASVRGGSGFSYGAGSRVLALIDGLPVLSADAGNIKWQFLPLDNLSQIEIIKGASSVLYGSSALNGIINFRTADASPDKAVTKFFIESGIYGKPRQKNWIWWKTPRIYSNASFSHLQKYGNTDLSVAAGLYYDNGYRRLNDEKLGRLNIKLKHNNSKINGLSYGVNLNAGHTRKIDFLLWEDAQTGALKQNETTANRIYGTFIALDPFLYFKVNEFSKHELKTRIQFTDNEIPDAKETGSNALSFYTEYLNWKKLNRYFSINVGLTENYSRIISLFYGDHQSLNISGYSQIDANPGKKLKLVGGLRLEYNILDNIHDKLIPLFRTGINYQLMDYTFLRASFGQGYRFPSIAEKHAGTSLGAIKIFPNPEIKSESGWNSEIGIRQGILSSRFNGMADLALFYSENRDLIEYIFGSHTDSPGSEVSSLGFKSFNIEHSRVYGCEFEFLLRSEIYGLHNTFNAAYVYIFPVEFNPVTRRNTNVFLKYRRKHSGKINLNSQFRKFEAGISMFINSKILNIDNVFVHELTRESILPGFFDYWSNNNKAYLVTDLNLAYNFPDKKNKLSLVVKNFTNTEYMGRPGDIMPHRNLSIRYSVKL